MAKVRKKYNKLKSISREVNYIMRWELDGTINYKNETLAYIKNNKVVCDELLCRLLDLANSCEIMIIHEKDRKHYNTIIKDQFYKNDIINAECVVEEAEQLRNIVKVLATKYKQEQMYLTQMQIELIETISNYVIQTINNLKCRITFAHFMLYARQHNKLFLLKYEELLKYYLSTLDEDMIVSLKYRINYDLLLYKYNIKKEVAIFNFDTFKFDFIKKTEVEKLGYKKTNLEFLWEKK